MPKSVGERLSESMTEFSGSYNSQLNEKYERIADDFTINSPSEEGIDLRDISVMMADAREELGALEAVLPEADYRIRLSVKKLGRKKSRKDRPANDGEDAARALQMARVLAAYNEDIELSIHSRSNQADDLSADFVISMRSESEEPLVSMLRGVYGQAEVERFEEPRELLNTVYASGRFVFRGKEAAKREKEYRKYESWISTALRSLPSDRNFSVSMRFCPVEDAGEIERTAQKLARIYRRLKFYSETSWSNASNIGSNLNHEKNIVGKTKDGWFTHDVRSENYSMSMTLSGKEEDKEAQLLMSEIEHALTRLNTASATELWGVGISVSADSEETLETVTSLLSGTIDEAGFALDWSMEESGCIAANTDEILPLMRFPDKEFAGFEFAENEEFLLVSQSSAEDGFKIGNMLWNGKMFAPFYLSPAALARHAFICGMTGAGKSNTLFNIIGGINLPFCVIEPVKGEYRALGSIYRDLKVWTMKVTGGANDNVSVMRINPFWFPENSNLAFHIDSIKTIIASAFELTAAMPNILEQCLYNIYVNSGWDLVTNRNIYRDRLPEEYLYPTFSDLCSEIEDYLDRSDFDSEVLGNYKGALLTRIKSFINGYKGILLNTTAHPDYSEIMNGHCVIELEGLADDADKCLVMGTILVQYYQYLKLNFKDNSDKRSLKHIIVIEEAHRLFKNVKKDQKSEGSDPTGQLVDSLSNMMAEIRAFGEGMLIVDQSPTKLADDVIKNSAAKIIHRIDNGDDIKALQSAMLLPDDILSFAALKQGEALIRADGMTKPCKVKILRSDVKEDYSLSASFRPDAGADSELAGIFAANSILYSELICRKIQDRVIAFLNSLILTGIDNWYGLMSDLIYETIQILREHKVYDTVGYRLSVLFEIISLAVRRMGGLDSKKDLGMAHMFIMRMAEFYRDQRDGKFIKPDAERLFGIYLDENIAGIMCSVNMKGIDERGYVRLCRSIQIDSDEFFATVIGRYADDLIAAAREIGKTLEKNEHIYAFILDRILYNAQNIVFDKYRGIIEGAAEYIEKAAGDKDRN